MSFILKMAWRDSRRNRARLLLFISAALPNKIYPPRFNRYAEGGSYGAHIDSALMRGFKAMRRWLIDILSLGKNALETRSA